MIKIQLSDHLLLDIEQLANWFQATQEKPLTQLVIHNWVGSYFTHFQLQGANPFCYEFHLEICRGEHSFEKYTDRVPFLKEIVGHSLGCVMFSHQPVEIFARVRNTTRELAYEEIKSHIAEGNKLKFVDIIQSHFESEYGIHQDEFNILKEILGLKQAFRLPSDVDCYSITEEIIKRYFQVGT
jgi:hypothetical protein